jgi:hypothetical protein
MMTALFFAQRAQEAKENLKDAIGKAQRDAKINKQLDALEKGMVTDKEGQTTFDKEGSVSVDGNTLDPYGFDQRDNLASNPNAVDSDGKYNAEEKAGFQRAIEDFRSDNNVQDDQINMVLVQMAKQEFDSAINGLSQSAKATGDNKKSITDRF